MKHRLRRSAISAYLLLCLVLGGSSQGAWTNALLQLLAILLLAWAAIAPHSGSASRSSRALWIIILAALLLVLLQLVPLPPALWRSLPGRQLLASGYELLGYELPWLPLSMEPYATLSAAYALLPPLAVLVLVLFDGEKEKWIAWPVLLGALLSVVLGAIQVASAGGAKWAYLHSYTNTGAVGIFANRNHMATLLLASIPLAAALFASNAARRGKGRGSAVGMASIAAGGLILLVLGLLLNSSLAALALAIPVMALSALLLPSGWRLRRVLIPVAAIALLVSVAALASGAVRTQLAGSPDLASLHSRGEMWEGTMRLIAASFPFGTGLGTFPAVYALHENPAAIEVTYINHAHNDYLELALETGLAGLLILAAFLAWWAWHVVLVWRSAVSSAFAKAATIASAAILVHSIVDYPLRTAAIAAVFAACIALMTRTPREGANKPRHVRIA